MQIKNLPGIIRTSLHVCKLGVVSSEIKNEILMSYNILVTKSLVTFNHMTRGLISLCSRRFFFWHALVFGYCSGS